MKNRTKFKSTLLTMMSSILNTLVVSVLGLVYNNLIIRYYGSSINGLISTLTQFVSIFTIIEGGFSVAAVVSSYDSILKRDYKKLNEILYTTRKYLRKIAIIFTVICTLLGLVYIQFIESPLNFFETTSLLFITIITTAISFGIISSYTIAISGHNSEYIITLISSVSRISTWILSIFLIINKVNIIWVYLLNIVNIVANVISLKLFLKKKYPYINYKGICNKELIGGTKDVLFQKIASTIFTSTDLVLISVGISLAMSSVYNLYIQIFRVIFNFLISIIEAPFNSFGQLFSNKEYENISEKFNLFKKITQIISTLFLTITGMSLLGFVTIYTDKITDVNYFLPILVLLLYTQFFLQLNNRPYGLILNASGNFYVQNIQCGISAVVNIVLSLVLMNFIGVYGIVFGSIVGTLIILIMNIYQCYRYVIKGKFIYDLLWQIINYLIGLNLIVISLAIHIEYNNYLWWGCSAVINTIISLFVICGINVIMDKKNTLQTFIFFKDKIIKKIHNR